MQEAQYFYMGVALVGSLLTLVSMTKVYVYAFWGEEQRKSEQRRLCRTGLLPVIGFLILLTVTLGILGEPVLGLAQQAAEQLMSPQTYIEAVFAATQGTK